MLTFWEFYVFMIFIIIASIIAVETKNLLSAVICISAAGFGGSLLFLFLKAPDIAITQVVVEVLALVILIRATIARDKTFVSEEREFFGLVVSIVILCVIFLAGIKAFDAMPQFGQPAFVVHSGPSPTASQDYLKGGLKETGAANIVSSVILDYRAYDTLGEATVLFTSIVGAAVILRRQSKKETE